MAKDKEGFILYRNIQCVVELMDNNDAGELFKLILNYVNKDDDAPDPVSDNMMINVAFMPIKAHLKADLVKWRKRKERFSEMGKKSAQMRNATLKPNTPQKEINNKSYLNDCLNDAQWLEVTAMQKKIKIPQVKKELLTFESHLIQTSDNKTTLKDFKSHFTYWMNKKPPTKGTKINYYS